MEYRTLVLVDGENLLLRYKALLETGYTEKPGAGVIPERDLSDARTALESLIRYTIFRMGPDACQEISAIGSAMLSHLGSALHSPVRRIDPMYRYLLALAVALHAAPAAAGSVVATPALISPLGGGLQCIISNASDKKPITVEWAIYDFTGAVLDGPFTSTLDPFGNSRSGNPVSGQAACIAKILKGGSKNLRVVLYVQDANGGILAAVSGR